MDITHLHLLLNHVPVLGAIFGFFVITWGVLRRSDEVKIAGLITLVGVALVAIAVYLTGEPAEEMVEGLPGVSENIIDRHEDWASTSLVFAIVSGVFALIALSLRQYSSVKLQKIAIVGTLFLSLVTGVLMTVTANLGGQIRHTEIRAGGPQNAHPAETKQDRKDDDDR